MSDADALEFDGFDWDMGNVGKNLRSHNVSEGACEELFFNSPLFMTDDPKHSTVEKRVAAFGVTNLQRRLTVVFTKRGKLIRVISARDMNKREREFYEKAAEIQE